MRLERLLMLVVALAAATGAVVMVLGRVTGSEPMSAIGKTLWVVGVIIGCAPLVIGGIYLLIERFRCRHGGDR